MKFRTLILTGLLTGSLMSVAQAIQVSPSYQIFDVKPGIETKGECLVTNNEDEIVTVKTRSKDWFVLPENKGISAADWLLIDVPQFQLQKGEQRTVPFIVKVPTNTVGELVGMVSMEFSGEQETMLKQVVSVAVYGAVAETEDMQVELAAIMIAPSTGTFQVGVKLKNNGNVHIRPTGDCWIYDKKGKVVANVLIRQGRPTYPGREGDYFGQLTGLALKKGEYTAKINLQDVDRHVQILDSRNKFRVLDNNRVELKKEK